MTPPAPKIRDRDRQAILKALRAGVRTSVTVTFTVAVSVFGSAPPFVVPLSVIVYVNESGPL